MADTLIDDRYSTTRQLIGEKPDCFDSAIDRVTTLLKTPDTICKNAEGGLRLQGLYKIGTGINPLITVVTVVFNGVEHIEDTIESVINQTYGNVEFIIVDGGSEDGTLDIIKKYDHAIDYWVSEPDKGIYEAMNKGIDLGCGDWINFMNAGDSFFNYEVLSLVFLKPGIYKDATVIYGDHEIRYLKKRKIVKAGNLAKLWTGSQFCHQSAFVRLKYHKTHQFNSCRKIAADFEVFYLVKKTGLILVNYPSLISKVNAGGVSDIDRVDSILERWLIVDKGFISNFCYLFIVLSCVIKSYIKRCLNLSK